MTLWRLEMARLLRTQRWLILVAVIGTFAVTGPLLAAYLEEILGRLGDEVVIELPEQRPVDGIAGFVDSITEIGVLAVVIVAAGTLAMDARPEMAAFLRTRVNRARSLVVPRYAVVAGAAAVTLIGGMGVAWVLTVLLIGPLPVGPMLVGTLCSVLYFGFAVAVVAAAASVARGVIGTIAISVATLLVLPIVAFVRPVRPWLPSELLTAVIRLTDGASVGQFTRAGAVTAVAIPALLALASHRLDRREL